MTFAHRNIIFTMIGHRSPLVSVIIPTYNYGRYLNDAIDSALSQTYDNIEVIVVDDGSTDGTKELVAKYGDVVTYYFKDNGGVSSARNFGVKNSKGDVLCFLDSDDKLHPTFVEKTCALLMEQAADIGFVYTQQRYFGARDTVTNYRSYDIRQLMNSNFIPANCLVKSELAKRFRYDEDYSVLEDWDFYLTLAENGYAGVLLNEPLCYYRKHLDQGSALDSVTERRLRRVRHQIMAKHKKFYGVRRMAWYDSKFLVHEVRFVIQNLRLRKAK